MEGLSNPGKKPAAKEEEARKQVDSDSTMFRPDFSQMVPFKPKVQWTPGEHIAPGNPPTHPLPFKDPSINIFIKRRLECFL